MMSEYVALLYQSKFSCQGCISHYFSRRRNKKPLIEEFQQGVKSMKDWCILGRSA